MAYSLNTLNNSQSTTEPTTAERFAQEIALLLGGLILIFWVLALVSYSSNDAAWSTTGIGSITRNWGGRIGANVADLSYYFFGFSIWWCIAALASTWFVWFVRWLRHEKIALTSSKKQAQFWLPTRVRFWGGLVLLLCVSTALEWARLYRFEALLPGHSGGVLGYILGRFSVTALGFTGAALACISLGVIAVSMLFQFTWSQTALRLGEWLENFIAARRQKNEVAQDMALGKAAALEREIDLVDERIVLADHHPTPVRVEPVMAEVPPSVRVAKERQKPLFVDMLDSKLPQVDLLDGQVARQETVSPETLEMTSRLIEKKLKDFGVEVRVVLASPGPVITRYEIEPAIGVKGSQIVGLAKDLARSLSLVSIRVVETIPGKNYMALELPNARRQTIKLSEILGSDVYNEAKSMLTMGLGKDIIGNAVVADLAKMPHVLVAGTTGSAAGWLKRANTIAYTNKLGPEAIDWAILQVQLQPNNFNWLGSAQLVRQFSGYGPQETLDLFRLMLRSGALDNEAKFVSNEYKEYIEAADPRRLPGEVVKVIDKGTAAGALSGGWVSEARATANGRIAADKASLGGQANTARDGNGVAAVADAYLNYGDAAKAEELYAAALAKGATDKDRVLTRLGIAQVDQGKWVAARDSFSKVAGTRTNLAKLWLIYVAQKSGGVA